VLDNSAWALNGDYGTTRWDSQLDALKTLYNTKMNSNPESVIGVMTMAGKSPEVLASPTQNFGAIISAIANVRLSGQVDLPTGINVAQLALKHRQNKNQRQRVIAFVGSPLASLAGAELVKLGKKLKKNNVAVDVVCFGEDAAEDEGKLREFVEAVNSADNSHLVAVPPGTVLLSDMILNSAMLAEDGVVPSSAGAGSAGGAGGHGQGGGEGDGDFGAIDPSLDPELAMALRMSLEEEQARQQRSQAAQGTSASASAGDGAITTGALAGETLSTTTNPENAPSTATAATALPADLAATAGAGPPQVPSGVNASTSGASAAAVGPTSSLSESPATVKQEEADTEDLGMHGAGGHEDEDEDADLAMALALSRGEGDVDMDDNGDDGDDAQEDDALLGNGDDNEEMTEDEAIARAIAMSMKEEEDQDQQSK